ncbi:MAG TPA: T9SS type A sorting domain-containing protein, partial [Bacteroidota bacterium]|nr:T9SS type A sorting domain-containing protein [Bacteroidota bacterium]
AANAGGTAGPASNWQDSGSVVAITASPNSGLGYAFGGWRGKGSGSYTGPNNPASVTMNAPINDTANFTLFPVHFTITTAPVGRTITVDGTSFVSPQTFTWITGSNHTVAVPDSQPLGARTRYMFSGWSDAGAKSHTVTPVRDSTVTASFSTQYFLVMNASGGGTVAPASNWYNSGQLVPISATPNSGYSFGGWNGAGNGSYTGPSASASVTMNDSVSETGSFVLIPVHVTIQTNPVGRSFTVDSTTYSTTQIFTWSFGTSHTISTATPQAGTTGVQYVWSNWSDGGAIAHSLTATGDTTIVANFATQFFLTMNTDTGGTVTPANGWFNSGQLVTIAETPNAGFRFSSWAGSGAGSYTGSNSSPTITMNAPITETASFVRFTAQVVVQTIPAGLVIFVDNTQYTSPHTFTWTTGSSHTIAPGDTLSGGTGIQYVWNTWSDGGTKSHAVSPLKDTTFTANYTTRYFLTMTANPGGTVAPASGWFNSGQIVSITAVPASRYSFSSWSGSGNGSYSGYTNPWQVTMNGPITEIANFAQNAVQITIQTNPPGRTYYFDYAPYTATLTRTVYPGEVHNLDVVSPQPGSSGSQYIWKNWSDGGSAAHAVTIPDSNVTYIVTYGTQYFLTIAANAGGTAGPASSWQDSGSAVTITAFPNTANGYAFSGWRGKGSGSYTGPNNPASVTMNAPINDTANFTLFPVHFTVTTAPVGRTITVDGTSFVSPQTFTWITGSNHTVAVPDSQPLGARTRYMFSGWSDAGAKSHTITPVRDSTVTASFSTQYFLVMNASGGGTVAPPSNWYNSGQLVAISATPNSGYSFGGWNGAGSGSYTGPSATASVTMNDSVSETASFVLIPVHVTIQTNPVGRSFTVDSTTYTTTQVFTWSFGTSHTISTATPQAGTTGVQYVWSNWSDGGPIAHSVAATSDSTIIANFAAQYFLTMSTDTSAGTVAPASNWYNGGQLVPISATPKPGFTFGSWAGSGAGSYTGSNSSPTVTMNAPITEAASFVRFTAQVVVQTNPAGLVIFVDNTQYASPHTFTWTTGSSHTIAPGDTLSGGPGIQYVWNNWSDGGLKSHAVSPLKDTTFTANYITRYFLTMTANPGGTVAPANGWFNSGQIVSITAVPASRYSFNSWSGSGTGSYSGYINPSQLTMNGPITEIASFAQNAVQITIQTNPSGRTYYFDGFLFTTPQTRTFQPGEIHYLEVFSPQASSPGKQYVWRDWSDSGTARHPVTIPDSAVTYTATFGTQYYLTMVALTGGSVSPASDWHDAGSVVQISATPDLSYSFLEWRGSGLGAYTGPTDTALVTMRGPITDTARFTQYPVHVTVGSNPPGRTLKVDGSSYTSSQQFTWISGSYHTVSTTVLQGDTLTRYNWLNWSDGGGISHTVSANRDTSFTTNFNTQHFLKVITGSGGTVTPPSDWHDLGQMVTIIAKPNPTYQFGGWNGTGSGSYSGNQDTAIVTVNAPITESASFVLQPISVTLRTNLPGRTFIVDSVRYTSTQTFIWQYGSNHTIGTLTPQAGAPSTRHLFRNWSDGGALSHRITPVMDTVFTANFSTQYFLWMSADSGGTASPPNSWQDSASTVQITGIPHPGYSFSSWNGNGNGSYTGTGNPDSVVMLESLVQTASFSRFGAQVVVQSSPGGLSITVDGVNYPSPQTFTWTTGSAHTVSAADTQSGTAGIRYVWNNWNDGKPRLHAVTPLGDTTFTANFKTQYYLTMTANAGGTVIPPSGWFTNGQNVTLTALPDTRYNFNVWSGTGPASYTGYQNPVTLTIGAPTSEIASFIRKPVQIVIQSVPPGRPFWYDGYTYTDPQTRTVDPGVEHFLGATSPQPITPFVLQYAFKNWSDGGGVFHSIFPDSNTTYTITFKTQYYLTLAAETGGNATPASDWQDSGKVVSIYAVANDGFGFQRWSGIGAGAYAGSRNPATVTMMGPISDTAFFGPGIKATFVSNPAGRKITVDDSTYIAPKSLNWLIGSAHTIKTASPQSDTAGTRYIWKQWSDSGAVTHNIAPTRDTTIAANFRTEYYLAVSAGSGGRALPLSGWCVKDSSVLLQAFPDSGQGLLEWIGTGPASYSGSSNPVRITMTSWVNEIAHFGRLLPPPTLAGTDGETNQPTSKMLNWHTYPGATLYQLQVATDSLFANIIVDLTTTSDTSFQVNALANLTTYYWHVKARVGNDITTFSGSRRFTTMAATLTAISPVRNWATKFIFPIRWKSTDLSGNVNIKLSTDGGYIYTMIMANVPNSGNASWSVPDSARWISSNCKLRIESVLNTAIFDESFVFSIASGALPATALVSTSISYPDDRAPTTAYRLVGGPGIVDTVRVSSILTGKQKIDWRVFWDNGAADNYLVELSGTSNLITGAGYWVLNKGNLDVSTTMRMPPLAADATFSIPLHAAWNIIANPFDKNVSWISVQDANGLPAAARILSYSGSYDSSGTMQTFGGYYYFNASNATSLKIPYPFGLTQPMRARQAVREDDGWKVRLSYETDINRDADNYIGITPGAKAGYDELETHKPPLFLDQGFLYFPRPDWDASYSRFNTDFRPALGDGQVWEFEVMNPRKSRGVIRLGGIEGIPAENQVILVGEYESTPIDMRKDNSYTFTPAADRMKFRLITGKQTFVEKELGKLAPQAYELAQNFPNPFNSTTAISVKLPEDSKIRLEIYSTLGQRIAELADGLYTRGVHTFRWQGTDEAGRAVATGVYFYRLTYGTNLVQSKKMIIAK